MKKIVKAKLVHKKKKPNIAQVGVKYTRCFWLSSDNKHCLNLDGDGKPYTIICGHKDDPTSCHMYEPCISIEPVKFKRVNRIPCFWHVGDICVHMNVPSRECTFNGGGPECGYYMPDHYVKVERKK